MPREKPFEHYRLLPRAILFEGGSWEAVAAFELCPVNKPQAAMRARQTDKTD